MGRLLLDGVVALLFCLVVGLPSAAVGRLAAEAGWFAGLPWWRWALLPLLVLLFLVTLLLTAGALRLLFPRLRPGRYPFPRHPQSIVWLLHFSLQRLLYLPTWRHLLFAFSTLRWALLRALGGRVAFDVDTSSDVLVLDPSLVELGAGAMVGAGSTLSGHLIERGTLFLARVSLGPGAEVGSNVLVGPGASIGEHAVIGPDCRIAAETTVAPYAYLGAACYLGQGAQVGAHAVVGHQVSVGPAVVIGQGAVIESGSRIPRGTIIDDGVHYPPRSRAEER